MKTENVVLKKRQFSFYLRLTISTDNDQQKALKINDYLTHARKNECEIHLEL